MGILSIVVSLLIGGGWWLTLHVCHDSLRGAPVVHWVERVPARPSPYLSDQGLIPAPVPLLHVFPSFSHTFLSYSTIKTIKPLKKKPSLQTVVVLPSLFLRKQWKSCPCF